MTDITPARLREIASLPIDARDGTAPFVSWGTAYGNRQQQYQALRDAADEIERMMRELTLANDGAHECEDLRQKFEAESGRHDKTKLNLEQRDRDLRHEKDGHEATKTAVRHWRTKHEQEKAAHEKTKTELAALKEERVADESFREIHGRACPDCRQWVQRLNDERDRHSATLRLLASYQADREVDCEASTGIAEANAEYQARIEMLEPRLHRAETALRTSTKETPLTHGRAAGAYFAAYPEELK